MEAAIGDEAATTTMTTTTEDTPQIINDGNLDPADVNIKAAGDTHGLRVLATSGNNMSEKENLPQRSTLCFVDVVGPDGCKKRFARGTKAKFAVDRFNCQLKDPAMPVVCIVACKEGEPCIEFGDDVELVFYDDSWTLKTLREVVPIQRRNPFLRDVDPIDKLKDTIKEGATKAFNSLHPAREAPWAPIGLEATNTEQNQSTKSKQKKLEDMDPMQYFGVKNWEDLYPGGKLPEGGPQECSPAYVGKVILMFIFVFAFAGGLTYMLDNMPEPTLPFS